MRMTLRRKSAEGCTAVSCMLQGSVLSVGNIGDSRAVLASASTAAERITLDHKPNERFERKRILQAGGMIIYSGCHRVSHPLINVRLSLSRALGDRQLKVDLPASCVAPLVPYRLSVSR
jgi:serine/threonine protein phosphatase PrpC